MEMKVIPQNTPDPPRARLGVTLVELLHEAERRYGTVDAFRRRLANGWETLSLTEFRTRAERQALGLLSLGLRPGDRVALFMDSDTGFCLADHACLIAGLPDVPLYLTQSSDMTRYILEHSEARVLYVTQAERWAQVLPALPASGGPEFVIVLDGEVAPATVPGGARLVTADELEQLGAEVEGADPGAGRRLGEARRPGDLATIIYTSGTTGQPKGVMLSHENLGSNGLYAFESLTGYRSGPDGEVVLSFLPMSHVFARTLCYAAIAHGSRIRFSTPDRLTADLSEIRPTVLATVPRVLEKVYASISAKSAAAKGFKGAVARWGLNKAARKDTAPSIADRFADRLVWSKWRDAFGGRIRYVPCGGAALDAGLARVFTRAGIQVLEGYGLTETSPVIAVNRPGRMRPGWVGQALPHVEIRIEEDSEIVTRGPHVMLGYYREPGQTQEVIDADGWFHTGDIGELASDGFLRITDRKKSLFKLSTGKYVIPQPIENRLSAHPLIEQAVVVGAGRSFATALVFPVEAALRQLAHRLGLGEGLDPDGLVRHEAVRNEYARVLGEANRGVDPWVAVKRFNLVPESVSVENGLLTPTLKVRRARVETRYETLIARMYEDDFIEPVEVT